MRPGSPTCWPGPPSATWAQDLLGRLDSDARDLRRTLRTWIAAGGNAERAAQALGVHAQTVREHVRSAEPVLERQLLAAGSDLYEVVLAHLAVGDLEPPRPRPEQTGLSGLTCARVSPVRSTAGIDAIHKRPDHGRKFRTPRGHDRNGGPVALPARGDVSGRLSPAAAPESPASRTR